MYEIIRTMLPPGYHENDFVGTHALGHIMYGSIPKLTFMYKNK